MKTLAILLVILVTAIIVTLIFQQPNGPSDIDRLRDDAHQVGHDAVKATHEALDATRDAVNSATDSVVR